MRRSSGSTMTNGTARQGSPQVRAQAELDVREGPQAQHSARLLEPALARHGRLR